MFKVMAPLIVDDRGNISLHTQQGAKLLVEFYDSNHNPLDVTERDLWFEISNNMRTRLVSSGAAHQKLLELHQGTLNPIVNRVMPFVVIDETEMLHHVVWEGQISVRGWQ